MLLKANQRIYDAFTKITLGEMAPGPLGFYVPPIPNDSGLSLGALWSVAPPRVHGLSTLIFFM